MNTVLSDILYPDTELLKINYRGKTEHILYCVADFAGNVLIRGNLAELQRSELSIKDLKKGVYTLCIVDGDCLTTQRFQKGQ